MSEVKVNKISPRSGTAFTLGDSGDTFTIPSGATINNQGTAVNFGATGSASWVTTVKTSTFTAVAGEGYFVNTTGGVVSVNLPAGVAGAVVAIKDYAGTFDTNAVTLVQNGSDKIGGSTDNGILTTEGIAVTLVFVDSTQGWLVTDDGLQSRTPTNTHLVATGGTITCSGNFKIHTFTGPGTFNVTALGLAGPTTPNSIDYLLIAGGGSAGAQEGGGGGGAGGFRETPGTSTGSYTVSPIAGSVTPFTATVAAFPVVIGGGGVGDTNQGGSGSTSSFNGNTSAGGGGGGVGNQNGTGNPDNFGLPGGSGGGSGGRIGGSCSTASKGVGNTPPVSPSQGKNGGAAKTCTSNTSDAGGGGGGATANALSASGAAGPGGDGGAGATTSITGSPIGRAGGGGGGGNPAGGGGGGASDGGGAGTTSSSISSGTANTGGGGGGSGGGSGPASNGGSGVVVIRYRFQ